MEDVRIFEHCWPENGKQHKVAILWGAMSKDNPVAYMNAAVQEYVRGTGHNEFVEINMDNPWIRVIVKDINEIPFVDFTTQRL